MTMSYFLLDISKTLFQPFQKFQQFKSSQSTYGSLFGRPADRVLKTSLKSATSGVMKKGKECFDELSINGNFSVISILSPFVLSLSKDSV
jgi:hypothetical protein